MTAQIDTADIDPGKPWQNGSNESVNGKFRDECLSMEWFTNRTDAKILIENWRRHYNEVRPHSSLPRQSSSNSFHNSAQREPSSKYLMVRRKPAGHNH